MAHEIQADSNTAVGYNFLTKEYYVKNLDTKTTLSTALDAKQILDITAPFNTVSESQIQQLSVDLEPLYNIKYAWEDTGKYIKAIYFNGYIDHSIIYNEPFIYIKGSNEMWDMSSSVSKETIRDFFWSYYTYNLGLDIPIEVMSAIIKYYEKIQSPYAYNNIVARESSDDTLMYNNIITLNNPDGSCNGEYYATKNPNNVYAQNEYDVIRAGQVVQQQTYPIYSMSKIGNTILLDKVYSAGLTVGKKITVVGTQVNDKDYTLKTVTTRVLASGKQVTELTTNEIISNDFISVSDTKALVKVESTEAVEENSITLTTTPQVEVGELIQLRGSANVDNLIVSRVEGNKILLNNSTQVGVHTEEDNKLYTSAYKVLKIGYDDYVEIKGSMGINRISGTTITPSTWLKDTDFKVGQEVYINYGLGLEKGPIKVTAITPSSMNGTSVVNGTITVSEAPGDYTSTVGNEPATIEVRDTASVEENSITISKVPSVKANDIVSIKNSEKWDNDYTVESIETLSNGNSKIWVKVDDSFEGFTEIYIDADQTQKAVLQTRKYSDMILLNMTYSKWVNRMPSGEFMLDNDQQLTSYLENYFITTPTSNNYAEINQPVPDSYYLGDELAISTMDCVGLYSENYEDEDTEE